jgi:hypothetical protein
MPNRMVWKKEYTKSVQNRMMWRKEYAKSYGMEESVCQLDRQVPLFLYW